MTKIRERAGAGTFWHRFFDGFGSWRRRVASLEVPAQKAAGRQSYFDLRWKNLRRVAHKRRGENLLLFLAGQALA